MIVIGIKGYIGSGKSTAARYLVEQHGFVPGRWAGALKAMLRAYLAYRGCDPHTIERLIEGDLKEEPSEWLGGKTSRHAMEGLGGGWGRDHMGSDFWIGTETDHLWPSMPERVVFEDTRHLNEAEAIDRMGGRIVEIFRPGLIPKDHRTEYAQRAINAHHIVRNCTGDLADTYEQIDKIVRMMVGRSERMSAL